MHILKELTIIRKFISSDSDFKLNHSQIFFKYTITGPRSNRQLARRKLYGQFWVREQLSLSITFDWNLI